MIILGWVVGVFLGVGFVGLLGDGPWWAYLFLGIGCGGLGALIGGLYDGE